MFTDREIVQDAKNNARKVPFLKKRFAEHLRPGEVIIPLKTPECELGKNQLEVDKPKE